MSAAAITRTPSAVGDRLPNLVVIGAMKCGTTALHRMLAAHPDIAMSTPKELNFFFGSTQPPADDGNGWVAGNWWRGLAWYAAHFPAEAAVRGETSPGYTSPAHPEAAERMAAVLPHARLVYLVRDPIDRAVSQYRHHVRDGTETRPVAEALADPRSQYLARSRYHARLVPFLDRYPRDHILIVAQEELAAQPAETLAEVHAFAGVHGAPSPRASPAPPALRAPVAPGLHAALASLLADDAARLRAVAGRQLPVWSV